MDIKDLKGFESGELDEKFLSFFEEGGTFKDMKNMSDEAMEAIYSVAYNLYQGGKYEEATKIFQFLCFYDHFNCKYYLGMGACLQMQKKYDTAIQVFSFASLLDSDDPRAMMYVGDCHMAKDDREQARIAYEMAIDWAGDSLEYAKELERAKARLEDI